MMEKKERIEYEVKENYYESLLLVGFVSSLGGLADNVTLGDLLDDTDSDGLSHVTDCETTEGRVLGEHLYDH